MFTSRQVSDRNLGKQLFSLSANELRNNLLEKTITLAEKESELQQLRAGVHQKEELVSDLRAQLESSQKQLEQREKEVKSMKKKNKESIYVGQIRVNKPLHEMQSRSRRRQRIRRLQECIVEVAQRFNVSTSFLEACVPLQRDQIQDIESVKLSAEKQAGEEDAELVKRLKAEVTQKINHIESDPFYKLERQVKVQDMKSVSDQTYRNIMLAAGETFDPIRKARRRLDEALDIAIPVAVDERTKSAVADVKKTLEFACNNVYEKDELPPDGEPLCVVVAMDGRSLHRNCDNVLLVCRPLLRGRKQHSHKVVWPLGIYNCKESRTKCELDQAMASSLAALEGLQNSQGISVGSAQIKIKLFVGGDLKNLMLARGQHRPCDTYSCLRCCCTVEQRRKARPRYYQNKRKGGSGLDLDIGITKENLWHFIPLSRWVYDTLHLNLRSFDNFIHATCELFVTYELPFMNRDDYSLRMDEALPVTQVLVNDFASSSTFAQFFSDYAGAVPYMQGIKEDISISTLSGNHTRAFFNNCVWSDLFKKHSELGEKVQAAWDGFAALYDEVLYTTLDVSTDKLHQLDTKLKHFASSLTNLRIQWNAARRVSSLDYPTFLFKHTIHKPYLHLFAFETKHVFEELKQQVPQYLHAHVSFNSFCTQSLEASNLADIRAYFTCAARAKAELVNKALIRRHQRRIINLAEVQSLHARKPCPVACCSHPPFNYAGCVVNHVKHKHSELEESKWDKEAYMLWYLKSEVKLLTDLETKLESSFFRKHGHKSN